MAEKDAHSSPNNPDNKIELERQAADREHEAKIAGAAPDRPAPDAPGNEAAAAATAAAHHGTRAVRRGRHGTKVVEVPSTGHSWDGIEEYDNPLPRWWLWTFYATVVWAIAYVIAYPAWPLISGATPGLLGHSTRGDVAAEIQRFDAANADIQARLVAADLTQVSNDTELANYARNAGAAVFRTNCAQCHGSGAAGNVGYPNLLDNDWLWGGDIDTIHTTIVHGIRSEDDPETRISDMPRFGVDGLLDETQIKQVVEHVLKISGQEFDATLEAEGATVFADNCASCHGENGEGMRDLGAPSLNNQIWLYGGTREDIHYSVVNARRGVMPAWGAKLSDADIRAVSLYVHGLGGGE
ncbi:cytochrome-c oxidase, cbb3-type subunit III [Paracoccus sp. p4-l81]|uniref:cytochrome-c oxidase, cbb3-type subunit III n=1 Tax=unclassified Paracoccus (in: a-proteobacteria) TaxID=2688777 RepID=UPI0035B8C8F6